MSLQSVVVAAALFLTAETAEDAEFFYNLRFSLRSLRAQR